MARNYETIYRHSSEAKKVHRFTQKHSYIDISDILNFLISLKKLLYTNFGIGDVVAYTTPMTTLEEPLACFCRNSDKDSASSWRTYRTDNLHIINVKRSILVPCNNNVAIMFIHNLQHQQIMKIENLLAELASLNCSKSLEVVIVPS